MVKKTKTLTSLSGPDRTQEPEPLVITPEVEERLDAIERSLSVARSSPTRSNQAAFFLEAAEWIFTIAPIGGALLGPQGAIVGQLVSMIGPKMIDLAQGLRNPTGGSLMKPDEFLSFADEIQDLIRQLKEVRERDAD